MSRMSWMRRARRIAAVGDGTSQCAGLSLRGIGSSGVTGAAPPPPARSGRAVPAREGSVCQLSPTREPSVSSTVRVLPSRS